MTEGQVSTVPRRPFPSSSQSACSVPSCILFPAPPSLVCPWPFSSTAVLHQPSLLGGGRGLYWFHVSDSFCTWDAAEPTEPPARATEVLLSLHLVSLWGGTPALSGELPKEKAAGISSCQAHTQINPRSPFCLPPE